MDWLCVSVSVCVRVLTFVYKYVHIHAWQIMHIVCRTQGCDYLGQLELNTQ